MFKKMRFKVNSPEHSAQIQKALFSLGYKWAYSGKVVENCEKAYLFADDGGDILHSNSYSSFDDISYALCKVEVVEKIKVIEDYKIIEESPNVELVELNGRKYSKEDLEKALDALTPVE